MKTQRALLSLVLIAVTIGTIWALSARAPRYHGRTLTSWLRQCSDTPLNETQRLQEAQNAIRAIGAKDALPRLLNLVETTDDPVSLWLIAKTDKYRTRFLRWKSSEQDSYDDWQRSRWHSAEDFQQLGIAGFEVLGTNAAPAVAELTKLLNNKEHAFVAVRSLVAIGTPAEQSVVQALTNQSTEVRYFATQQFAWVTDDDQVYLAKMRECLKDADGSVRFAAVQGIGVQAQAPDLAITLLLEALRDKQDTVASSAAKFLANFGTNAERAFPDLSDAVEHGSPNTVYQALKTLVAIAPAKALPIVFDNFRSADSHRRRISAELLNHYPATNSEIRAAIQQSATDPDPALARRAKELITKKYQSEHPMESRFSDDPSYEGKRLGDWLKMHDAEGQLSEAATNAIHHLGTDAIPALLQRLTYLQPPFGLRTPEVNQVHMDGVRGLIALGDESVPALPALQALMDSTNQYTVLLAMVCTLGTGTNAIPILAKGLTNQFAEVRSEAAHNLVEGIAVRFPGRRQEIRPLLVKLLNDPDPDVRGSVKGDLQEIDFSSAARPGIK